jgi:putative FmdB family regulatory protein
MSMPTYDYRCTKCEDTFAVEQSIKAKPLKRCKKCGGKLEKILSKGVSVIFKGSGFYETDYKHKSSAPASRKGKGGRKEGTE